MNIVIFLQAIMTYDTSLQTKYIVSFITQEISNNLIHQVKEEASLWYFFMGKQKDVFKDVDLILIPFMMP